MRALEVYKRQLQRLVGQAAGQNYDSSRPWSAQQVLGPHAEEVYALPVDAADVVDLNVAAFSFSLLFIPGLSDPGGTDVLQ